MHYPATPIVQYRGLRLVQFHLNTDGLISFWKRRLLWSTLSTRGRHYLIFYWPTFQVHISKLASLPTTTTSSIHYFSLKVIFGVYLIFYTSSIHNGSSKQTDSKLIAPTAAGLTGMIIPSRPLWGASTKERTPQWGTVIGLPDRDNVWARWCYVEFYFEYNENSVRHYLQSSLRIVIIWLRLNGNI